MLLSKEDVESFLAQVQEDEFYIYLEGGVAINNYIPLDLAPEIIDVEVDKLSDKLKETLREYFKRKVNLGAEIEHS